MENKKSSKFATIDTNVGFHQFCKNLVIKSLRKSIGSETEIHNFDIAINILYDFQYNTSWGEPSIQNTAKSLIIQWWSDFEKIDTRIMSTDINLFETPDVYLCNVITDEVIKLVYDKDLESKLSQITLTDCYETATFTKSIVEQLINHIQKG